MQAAFKVHRLTMCKSSYFVFIEKFIIVVIEVLWFLKVPEDLVEAITNKTETPAIVHADPEKEHKHKHNSAWELEALFLKYFSGILSNSKKLKTYNIFTNDPDFKNVHGWTTTVTKKQLKQLKRHNIGFLMVNLTMVSDYNFTPSYNYLCSTDAH